MRISATSFDFLTPADFGGFRNLEASSPRRLLKDVLRVGRWNVGGKVWDVTKETLLQIANNFLAYRLRGGDCPLVWNHSNDARDRVGDVEEVRIEGDRLLAVVNVKSDADAEQIQKVGKVSVSVAPEWTDGTGQTYREHLVHVGVVNHPVVPDQEPFVELSLEKSNMRKRFAIFGNKLRQLAVGEEPATGESVVEEIVAGTVPTATDATDKELTPLFRELFSLIGIPGIQLSADVNDSTLLSEVKILLNVAKGMKGEAPSSEPETVEQVESMPTDGDYASIQAGLKMAKSRLLSIYRARKEEAKQAFVARLDQLNKAGTVDDAGVKSLSLIGEQMAYDLSILKPFDRLASEAGKLIHTSSKLRNLAVPTEPAVGSSRSIEEIRKRAAAFVGAETK